MPRLRITVPNATGPARCTADQLRPPSRMTRGVIVASRPVASLKLPPQITLPPSSASLTVKRNGTKRRSGWYSSARGIERSLVERDRDRARPQRQRQRDQVDRQRRAHLDLEDQRGIGRRQATQREGRPAGPAVERAGLGEPAEEVADRDLGRAVVGVEVKDRALA